MKDLRTFLKIKIKSLAAEARIIRSETAKKHRADIKNGLANHRRLVVRRAMRNTLIAYAFIRGRSYKSIEPKCATPPDWPAIRNMVAKYGVYADSEATGRDIGPALAAQSARLASWMDEPAAVPQNTPVGA